MNDQATQRRHRREDWGRAPAACLESGATAAQLRSMLLRLRAGRRFTPAWLVPAHADGSVCALLRQCGQLRQLELRGLLYNADAAVACVADTCRSGGTRCVSAARAVCCVVVDTARGAGPPAGASRCTSAGQIAGSHNLLYAAPSICRHLTALDLRHCSTLSGGAVLCACCMGTANWQTCGHWTLLYLSMQFAASIVCCYCLPGQPPAPPIRVGS